ncbi:hypothetical protein NPIL_122461 [Nephila pilipes]|uniref:Uncharacterized protein n=1 Tax=Nephila pilipes TaxID=299642 RepID=A0A8X6P5N1_NEPPI|nr:hypothetical protein NPIL_122461 [Nephila pilipes]
MVMFSPFERQLSFENDPFIEHQIDTGCSLVATASLSTPPSRRNLLLKILMITLSTPYATSKLYRKCFFNDYKALLDPNLPVSIAYYKRNMYVFNAGFHNFHMIMRFIWYAWDKKLFRPGCPRNCFLLLEDENVTMQQYVIAYSDMCI